MDVYNFVSPFVAAFLASFLTYFFAIRAKKHEIVALERLVAFKGIHKVLLRFRKYYLARIGDFSGSDFAVRTEGLLEEENLSPLEQVHLLDSVLADNEIFLPPSSRELFDDLNLKLGLLCSSELYVATQIDEASSLEAIESQLPQFESALETIDKCIDALYKNLKLPK